MMGIYTITNVLTGQIYVVSALNFNKRFNEHKRLLKNNKHRNSYLQNSWNMYKEQNFRFQPEELVENKEELIPTEQ